MDKRSIAENECAVKGWDHQKEFKPLKPRARSKTLLIPCVKSLHSVKCSIFIAKETIRSAGTGPESKRYFVQEKHLFAAIPLKSI